MKNNALTLACFAMQLLPRQQRHALAAFGRALESGCTPDPATLFGFLVAADALFKEARVSTFYEDMWPHEQAALENDMAKHVWKLTAETVPVPRMTSAYVLKKDWRYIVGVGSSEVYLHECDLAPERVEMLRQAVGQADYQHEYTYWCDTRLETIEVYSYGFNAAEPTLEDGDSFARIHWTEVGR